MFRLAIALYTTAVPANHPIKTVYLFYPTQYTYEAAEQMLHRDKDDLFALTTKRQVKSFVTSCEKGNTLS